MEVRKNKTKGDVKSKADEQKEKHRKGEKIMRNGNKASWVG